VISTSTLILAIKVNRISYFRKER